MSAAKHIIASLTKQGLPPKMHSVWVQTRVNGEGEFTDHVLVALNPAWPHKPELPEAMKGYPVDRVEWAEVYEA